MLGSCLCSHGPNKSQGGCKCDPKHGGGVVGAGEPFATSWWEPDSLELGPQAGPSWLWEGPPLPTP